jgi:hypothetical protein
VTRYSLYQAIPAELYDDAPALDGYLQHLTVRLGEEVTALGHNVTSDVTVKLGSFWAHYEDLDGEYHQAPLAGRHPNLREFPCHRCRVRWGRCVSASGRPGSYFHRARYPGVFAGYHAWAETDKDMAAV